MYQLYLKLILSNQITPLEGQKSLYGPPNSWAGHIMIYGPLMAYKKKLFQKHFVPKKFGSKKIYVRKNCYSKKNVRTFGIINTLQQGWSGHTWIYSSLRSRSYMALTSGCYESMYGLINHVIICKYTLYYGQLKQLSNILKLKLITQK